MKIIMERSDLLKALNHAQGVVERRNTIPILSNVLLEATSGGVRLTATDMDLVMVDTTTASVEVEGSVTTSAHTLHDIVRKLSDGAQVKLEQEPGSDILMVESGRSNFKLQTLPASDFPSMDEGGLDVHFDIAAVDLRDIIDGTRFAISTDETRYYLNGIYFHVAEGSLRGVATDGHRLAQLQINAPAGAESMPGVIIPRKTVLELRKLIDETDDTIAVSLSENKIRFAFGGAVLTSKLIDGNFPDYEKVIPQGNHKTMELDCRAFAGAVDRVSTISAEKMCAVKIGISTGNVELSATSADSGDAKDQVEVNYSGDALEIGFNARYLLDVCAQVESGKAQFLMNDGASPTIIKDLEDDTALYVLMPMRV